MRRLREKAEQKAGQFAAAFDDVSGMGPESTTPVHIRDEASSPRSDSDASDMSEGEREFRIERAKRLEQLSTLTGTNNGILGSVKTPLTSVKTAMYKTGKRVGDLLEEAAEADMGGLGMDMAGGVDFGDMEEAYQARMNREREDRMEREREAERVAAERRAQLREWRVRAQVARDEVIAERNMYTGATAAPMTADPFTAERGKRNSGVHESPVRLTVAQALAALRFALGFAEQLPDSAVVEKALYELGISIPHDASRRAKVSVSCAALYIHTGWPPPVVGLIVTPSKPKSVDGDVVVRSFEEWRTLTPTPEPEPELELEPMHSDPLGMDSSSDSTTTSVAAIDDAPRQHGMYDRRTTLESGGNETEEQEQVREPLGVVEAAECLRRALRLSLGSDLPLPQRLSQVRNDGGDTAASRVGQLLKMVAQAAATQTEDRSGGEALWELLDTQCRVLDLETGWSPFHTAVWDWLPEPSAAELEAMTAAAAAQSRGSIAPICSRIVATIIPGAKHMQSEDALRGTTEFSPSKRRRADSVNRHARRNSPWNSEGEWVDETADEEEQSVDHFCCGLARVKNVETINAVRIRLPRSGRLIVGSAAFMAGLDAALLWASLPLAVISIADVSLPSVGVIVCLISAAHSLGQLLGAALIWHGRFRPLSRLKPLSMLLLGQIGLIVSFTALAIARSLLWIGCARLLGGLMHSQLSAAHVLMDKLVKRACRAHRLMDNHAVRKAAEEAATEVWQCWAVGGACGCGLGMALFIDKSQPLLAIAIVAALVALAVLVFMVVLIARDPSSPLPALVRKCRCCCCLSCAAGQQSSKDGYSALSRTDEDSSWGDDASIYSESFVDNAPKQQRGPMTWIKLKLKPDDDKEMEHVTAAVPAMERFWGEKEEAGWTLASLRLPDTTNANRATRSHVLLLVALMQLSEATPLFLSMPRIPEPTVSINSAGEAVRMSATDGDGSYALEWPVDEAAVAATIDQHSAISAGGSGGCIGLGFPASSIAIVGALTSLCVTEMRRLVGQKVDVSSPWVALRFGGFAVVTVAVMSPALSHIGASAPQIWFGIMLVKACESLAALSSAVAGASLHLAESSDVVNSRNVLDANTAQAASRAWIMLLRPLLQLGIGVAWSISVWLATRAGRGEEHLLLHPLLVYLVPACFGSISVWFALD